MILLNTDWRDNLKFQKRLAVKTWKQQLRERDTRARNHVKNYLTVSAIFDENKISFQQSSRLAKIKIWKAFNFLSRRRIKQITF